MQEENSKKDDSRFISSFFTLQGLNEDHCALKWVFQ